MRAFFFTLSSLPCVVYAKDMRQALKTIVGMSLPGKDLDVTHLNRDNPNAAPTVSALRGHMRKHQLGMRTPANIVVFAPSIHKIEGLRESLDKHIAEYKAVRDATADDPDTVERYLQEAIKAAKG